MFDADRPIRTSDQDRLGRSVFCKYLARCMLDHQNPDSLVIGLYGGWGSGKTSIINLTLQELRFASSNMFDQEKPIILNFSPWSYSGQNELIFSFFRRLSSEMHSAEYFENAEKIIYLLELYISFFSHQFIPKAFRPKHSWLKLDKTTKDRIGWESGRDLTRVKEELNELLRAQKHKIIIFIDNIARLQDFEIDQIFQIVKSIGDFNNTVYVLSMDKEYVIKAIDKLHKDQGTEYLEKLVQLPFEIPLISKQDLEIILLDKLHKVMHIVPLDSWDKDYWADIYYSTLRYFFSSSRDITRYINTLSFSYMHVKEVVNPVDFFAITAIEVFEPNVFEGIRDNKDLFVDMAEQVVHFDAEKLSEDKSRVDEILSRANTIPREKLLQLLVRLFPHLRRIFQSSTPFYHSEALARKNRRICTYDLFEVYFRLSLSKGDISPSELHAILAMSHDEQGFELTLLRLNQDDRIPKLLDVLDGLGVNEILTKNIPNVVDALMESADLFPQDESTALSFNIPMRIHRIFHQLLRRIDSNEKRFEIFYAAIQKATKSLYIIVHELMEQGRQHNENEDTFVPIEERDFSIEQLFSLRKLAVEKIRAWADNDRLVEHPKLIPILYAWKAWGDPEECKRYVARMIETDRGIVSFLGAALKVPVKEAITKEETNPAWKKYLQNIDDFIPLNALIPHAEELFKDNYFEKLKETEQLSLLIFLDFVKPNSRKLFPKTN